MGLSLITPPTVEPVTLADEKSFLRVGITDDDAIISTFITAARLYCEHYLGRVLITSTWLMTFDIFPIYTGTQFPWPFIQQVPTAGAYQMGVATMQTPSLGVLSPADPSRQTLPNIGNMALPRPKLQSVNWIKYLDEDGTLQTLDPSNYQVVKSNTPGYIKPINSWPTVQANTAESVQVQFVAGYGDSGDSVPETINMAIRLLAASWYETRQPSTVQAGIEQAVHALLNQHKFEGNA
jgi:hypothetical protein